MAITIYVAKDHNSSTLGIGVNKVAAAGDLISRLYGKNTIFSCPPPQFHERSCWGLGAYIASGEFYAVVAYIEERTLEGAEYANEV